MVKSKEEKAAYMKKYRANNDRLKEKEKEYQKEYMKKYRAKNKEKKNEYMKEYRQTAKGIKVRIIGQWKWMGVIGDLSTLYDERYLLSTNCEVCNKTYASSLDKCLDHCHQSGEFRQMLCRACNSFDNWKKIIAEKENLNIKE